jgi:hypothetical protein
MVLLMSWGDVIGLWTYEQQPTCAIDRSIDDMKAYIINQLFMRSKICSCNMVSLVSELMTE